MTLNDLLKNNIQILFGNTKPIPGEYYYGVVAKFNVDDPNFSSKIKFNIQKIEIDVSMLNFLIDNNIILVEEDCFLPIHAYMTKQYKYDDKVIVYKIL